jgi:cytochrome c553
MLKFGAARRMRRAVFVCSAVLLATAAQSQTKGDAAGGAAKSAVCASCHGAAKTPALPGMPTLAGQQPEFLVLQMFLIREGLRDVPQMAGMLTGWSDADLSNAAAHFAQQPLAPSGGKADPKLLARGEALAQSMGCGSCHMPDYRGQRQIPRIVHQREDYLAATLQAYRDNKRSGTDTSMNAAMYQVSDADIQALAHFLAHRK